MKTDSNSKYCNSDIKLPTMQSCDQLNNASPSQARGTKTRDLYNSVKSRYMHYQSYKKPVTQSQDNSHIVHTAIAAAKREARKNFFDNPQPVKVYSNHTEVKGTGTI